MNNKNAVDMTEKVIFGGEEYHVSPDEYEYLEQTGLDYSSPDWVKLNCESGNVEKVIISLFALSKPDSAWEIIDTYKDTLNFEEVVTSQFFQISRTNIDVYLTMYKRGIIDENTYAYFQVICGKLYDIDFWRNKFKNRTVSEKLSIVNESFNGVNPFEVGLVEPDEESWNLLMEGLMPNEKLDEFIIGSAPGVLFPPEKIIDLFINNNLEFKYAEKYLSIALQMVSSGCEVSRDIFALADEVLGEYMYKIKIDTIDKLAELTASQWFKDSVENHQDKVLRLLVNSEINISCPLLVYDTLKDNNIIDIRGSLKYLNPELYPYVISYRCLDTIYDTSDFVISTVLTTGFRAIYNKTNKILYTTSKIFTKDDIDILTSIESVNDIYDIFSLDKICESSTDSYEVSRSLYELIIKNIK